MRRLISLIAVLLWLGPTACGSGPALPTPVPQAQVSEDEGPHMATAAPFASPRPYQTATPAATLFVVTPLPPLTEMLLPTPTPFTYTVAAGDNLSGIATRFDVRLDDLLAANPGVSPTALQVGTLLTIPLGGNTSGEPTPTPVPLTILQTDCWPSAEGGLWCFALAHNNYAETIENLSVQFTLLDASGQEIGSQVAYGLLNILPAGRKMPLAAFFPAPLPADIHPHAQVLTAIRLPTDDMRYLPIALQNTLVRVDWLGRTAHVSGRAALTTQSTTAGTLWVLGVAYDQYGHVVGVRRWGAGEPLSADSILAFDFLVFSLGAPIDHVDLLVEAR